MKLERFQNLRPQKTPEQVDQQFKQVASLYEKQFLREMVKAMRSTVQESGLIKANQAEKIFKEQLDQEYVEKWGERGGIGLSDLIYNQLIEKYGAAVGLKKETGAEKGILPLDQKSQFRGYVKADHPTKTQVEFRRPSADPALSGMKASAIGEEGTASAVKSPWDGKISSLKNLSVNEWLIGIDHDNGLSSQFSYKGVLSRGLKPLDEVYQGQEIGVLSPEAQALYWNISPQTSSVSE